MRITHQRQQFWIAFDPFEQYYYDTTPADSTLDTIQTLEEWGEEGATIELVSAEEADRLLTGKVPREFNWRWPFDALFSLIQFLFLMTFTLILHPIDTLYRLIIILFIWWMITLGVKWLTHTYLMELL